MSFFKKLLGGNREKIKVLGKAPTQAAGDLMLLDLMRKQGANFSNPFTLQHYLYLPSEEAAEDAAGDLRSLGYEVEVRRSASNKPNDPVPWLALATEGTLVDERAIEERREQFDSLAQKYGGDYDGWEAAVQR